MSTYEGWWQQTHHKVHHYFRDGVSLCGKYKGVTGHFPSDVDGPKCKTCISELIVTTWDVECPNGFSDTKGNSNYWLDAVRDMWAETQLTIDEMDARIVFNYLDKKRKEYAHK